MSSRKLKIIKQSSSRNSSGDEKEFLKAIKEGNINTIKEMFLDNRINLNNQSEEMIKKYLMTAIENKQYDAFDMLLSRKIVNKQLGQALLLEAAKREDMRIAEILSLYKAADVDEALNSEDITDEQSVFLELVKSNIDFFEAIMNDDIETVKNMIDEGFDIETRWGSYNNPLGLAVNFQNYDITKLLLENGAKVNLPFNNELSTAFKDKNKKLVELLLEYGSSISSIIKSIKNSENYEEETKFFNSLKFPNVSSSSQKTKLSKSPTKNSKSNRSSGSQQEFNDMREFLKSIKETPEEKKLRQKRAFWAITDRDIKSVKQMLENGLNPNDLPPDTDSYLTEAVIDNNYDMAKLLLDYGAKVDIVYSDNIEIAARRKNEELVKLLMSHGEDINLAIRNLYNRLRPEDVKFLEDVKSSIERGQLSLPKRNSNKVITTKSKGTLGLIKETPEDKKIRQKKVIRAIANDDLNSVKQMFENGLDPNELLVDDYTYLQEAIEDNNNDMTSLFLEHGAKIDNEYGRYIEMAARNKNKYIIKLLMWYGEDLNLAIKNKYGHLQEEDLKFLKDLKSSLEKEETDNKFFTAIRNNDMKTVKQMIDNGLDINDFGPNTVTYLDAAVDSDNYDMVTVLLESGISFEDDKEMGAKLLLLAANHENMDIVYELIGYGADIDIALNSEDITSKEKEFLKSIKSIITFFEAIIDDDIETVGEMLENGFDIETKWGNYTPLGQAVDYQRYDIVKLLLENGAKVNHPFNTELFTAANYENKKLAKLLVEYGSDIDIAIENIKKPENYEEEIEFLNSLRTASPF
jgi:ankyrin repeat protein